MSDSEAGGCRDVTVEIKGDSVFSKLKFEAGVHRVQRVPATETQGEPIATRTFLLWQDLLVAHRLLGTAFGLCHLGYGRAFDACVTWRYGQSDTSTAIILTVAIPPTPGGRPCPHFDSDDCDHAGG